MVLPLKALIALKAFSQVGLVYLRAGLFLLMAVGLVSLSWLKFRLVLFAYGGNRFSILCLRFPTSGNWIWSFVLTVPPVQNLDSVFFIRSRPGKPNQKKAQNEKFMNFAHFCEFWCFSVGKQARFTLNFCSGMPLREVHELTFFGLVCRGHS